MISGGESASYAIDDRQGPVVWWRRANRKVAVVLRTRGFGRALSSERAEIIRRLAELPDQLGVAEFADGRISRAAERDAHAQPDFRESASARMIAALALRHSTASPAATPSSARTNGSAT